MDSESSTSEWLHGLTYTLADNRIREFALDENLPELQCNDHIPIPPNADLGTLNTLPLELFHEIIRKLDLRTLTDFRHVNRQAMWLVESAPQYKTIRKHAFNALRGILCIQAGRWITCEMLYNKLCTAECEQCGDFGSYLYILTCERVCYVCLTSDKRYLPLRYLHAIRKFGLNRPILRTLPTMKSIPGTYSPRQKIVRAHLTLVDFDCARRAGIALHGSVSAMEQYVSSMPAPKTRARRQPFDGKSENPLRFMAIVRTPWFNRSSQEPEWGFCCIACQKYRPLYSKQKFNVGLFKEHLRQCGNIQHGKHQLN